MKRIIVFVLLLGLYSTGFAQITRGEFFWDNDPGLGNATALAAEDGSFDNQLEIMVHQSIPALAEGLHVLHVRIKDNNNNWSPVFKTLVRVDKAFDGIMSHISMAEYFIDTDPGEGNGTSMVAFDGDYNDALETALLPMINTVSAGMHVLGVRVKDSNNNWSPAFKTTFKADGYFVNWKAPRIQAAEYFFDTDPGPGNAMAMMAFDGDFNDALEAVSVNFESNLSTGLHRIGFRMKNADNSWGKTFLTNFYAEPCPPLTIPAIADTSICAGQSLVLTAPDGFQSYQWNTGESGRTIQINQQGTYMVNVTDVNGCKGSATVNVAPNGPVEIDWLAAKGFSTGDMTSIHHADQKGNTYLAYNWDATMSSNIKIDGEEISSSNPQREIVLIKLNAQNQKVSTKKVSIPGSSLYLKAMTTDAEGNMYFSGWYMNGFTFNGLQHPDNEYFIIKTDSLANISWISTGGNPTTGGDDVVDLNCSNGLLYIAGRVERSGSFKVGNQSASAYGDVASFVACLNANDATCQWVNVIENDLVTKKVKVDYDGNVYLSGTYKGNSLQVNGMSLPASFFHGSLYSTNIYFSKFSNDGKYQWIKNISSATGYYDFKFSSSNDVIILCNNAAKNFYVNDNLFSFPDNQFSGGSMLAKLDQNGTLQTCRLLKNPYLAIESIGSNRFSLMGRMNFADNEIFGTDTLKVPEYTTERKFFAGIINENLMGLSGKSFLGSFGSNALNMKSMGSGRISVFGSVLSNEDFPYPSGYEVKNEEFGSIILSRVATNAAIAVLEPQKLQPWVQIPLPKDTAICEGQEIILSAPAHLTHYQWSNGSVDSNITLKQSSEVYLAATESHGCPVKSKPFRLTVNPLPQPRLGNDTIIAPDRFLVLFPGMFSSYLWHDNKTSMMNTIGLDVHTGTHTAWVKVTNEYGCVNTDSITITFSTVDVKNISNNTIYVYPVPARDFIHISSALQLDFVEIYDMSGRLMIKEEIHGEPTSRIDLSNFVRGNYLVKVFKKDALIKSFKFSKE